jgi:cysteine synthase A
MRQVCYGHGQKRVRLTLCSGARHLSKFWKNSEPVGGAENDVSLEAILEA